ncbi:hypothetical protein LCGC14_2017440 [marine sediment metagenome]|uniref:N-acetyltransferase domain-containing protein n=1 Tax=marine sediment metagenome TaxID=412755 RepID=A0A0F9FL05_9ZZZZ
MSIEFRQIEKEDLPQLRDWRNQERIRKNTREYKLLTMANQEEWFRRVSIERKDDMFLIEDLIPVKDYGAEVKPVGMCGLTNINWKDRHAEFSYYSGLENPFKNGKIAMRVYNFLKKKAFDEFNLNRLWGEIFSCNQPALKLAYKNGLSNEGVLRQTYFWGGKYWDSIIVSILAKEYHANGKDHISDWRDGQYGEMLYPNGPKR